MATHRPIAQCYGEAFVATLRAPLLRGEPWQIAVRGHSGFGLAEFPFELRDEAWRRFGDLNRLVDVENLLREWGEDAR